MKLARVKLMLPVFLLLLFLKPVLPQSLDRDSTFHPYHVNYWITGAVIVGGAALEKIAVPWISGKLQITKEELQILNRHDITPIDSWALDFDPSNMNYYVKLSDQVLTGIVLIPALTMLDKNIRKDWIEVLLMYLETMTITNNLYLYSPIGATFQNRLRPVVYYDALGESEIRTRSANRNSMYSGHVASASAASFFTAKIYCDYHPELGANKYFIYAAASIPPLIMSYLRLRSLAHFPTDIIIGFGIGALCGILIPEFHRINNDTISLAVFPSNEGMGISVKWNPGF